MVNNGEKENAAAGTNQRLYVMASISSAHHRLPARTKENIDPDHAGK